MNKYVERGHLTRREHPSLPLAIYNYTPRCTYDRAWDEVTLNARGLVVDIKSGEVVARPFPKFFNHGEPDAVLPEGEPDEVTVKADGALGIGFNYKGQDIWTTRGAFTSEQAEAANWMWGAQMNVLVNGWTYLAEVIHPSSKVIVPYAFEGFVLLAIRNTTTGEYLHRSIVEAEADRLGMRCVETVTHAGLTALIEESQTMGAHAEGWVCRWGDHRIKVKSLAYLSVARLMQGLNERRAADIWYAKQLLPPEVPEETQQWFYGQCFDLDSAAADAESRALTLLGPGQEFDMKRLAQRHRGHPLFPLIMTIARGKTADFRLWVYRQRFNGKPRPAGLR